MKTVKEVKRHLWEVHSVRLMESTIATIQLDAFKAGMTHAAEIINKTPSCEDGRNAACNAILTARDNLTTLPAHGRKETI